jgi:GntR family histidine utilization transcriptional repressor
MTKPAKAKRTSDTLHERIRADLEGKICSGRWQPGFRIPFEHELMEQYDCSRMTVNKVLSSLAKRGLIKRRRRLGSFVDSPTGHSAILEIPDIQGDIVRRAKQYRFELLSRRERPPRADSDRELELAAGGRLLDIDCLHYENDVPFAFEERLISLATVPDAVEVDFRTIAPGTWLLSHVPWSEAEHTITAVAASGTVARRLKIPARSACLSLQRRTWKRGRPVTDVRQWFPGDRHSLTARFRPSES